MKITCPLSQVGGEGGSTKTKRTTFLSLHDRPIGMVSLQSQIYIGASGTWPLHQ